MHCHIYMKSSSTRLNPLVTLSTAFTIFLLISGRVWADDIRSLPPVEVEGSRYSLLGVADTANEGVADQSQLDKRVVARTGEVLEVVPGLIVSQHSGEGKANQYFLRGFNLDHGTDLKLSLDGMPVNQRSHAHGQGWADLNPLIPELISTVHYRKGTYYVADGDFSNAGSANIYYADQLDKGIASLGMGQNGFYRSLIADAPKFHDGYLLYALELSHYDGPWDKPDNFQKYNGVLRYSEGNSANGFNLTAMAYSGRWNATDQIPWNEYKQGLISRWSSMDTTSGATASRNSLSGEWRHADADGTMLAQAYVINNYLDLYSNFEYSSDSQFNQRDSRVTTGFNLARTWNQEGVGKQATNTLGLQVQNDNIHNGIYSTEARTRIACNTLIIDQCRSDHITQSSVGLYAENHVHWNDSLRTVVGMRGDYFRFANVGLSSSIGDSNTRTVNDFILSPKINIVFGPWSDTEYYYSAGNGFHSNDARGVTIDTGVRSDGLVKTFGQEIGIRSEFFQNLKTTLALFQLDSASEIVYAADTGTTDDTGRRSRRLGLEFDNYYNVSKWLSIDADIAYARARFRDAGGTGQYIEGAVEGVASLAVIIDSGGPYDGSLQLRYFGPRPLKEDNSVRSESTMTLNGKLGYKLSKDSKIEVMGFNLLNSQNSAIDYYNASYTSSLGSGQSGKVFHPMEPRTFRLMLVTRY